MDRLSLSIRCRHACARSEITHVSLTDTAALAVYVSPPPASLSWVDTFSLTRKPGKLASLSKSSGSYGAFPPSSSAVGSSSTVYAALKDWTIRVSGGIEYCHSSSVLVRDLDSGKTLLELKDAGRAPIAWSRDARLVAAGEANNPERMGIWDAKTGGRVGRVISHIDAVTHAAFAPSSDVAGTSTLVTLSRDGTLRITNPSTSRTVARLELTSRNPRALAVAPHGNTIVSVWDSSLYVWHPRSGDLTSYALSATRMAEGWPLAISPDCRYVACRTEDGFDLMEVSSGVVVFGMATESIVTAAAFSSDSSALLLGRMDGVLELWDISERAQTNNNTVRC
ncbi:unnamed protein product [Clonostachys rhizophaga]|uniref:Vegetative incompatibility protein HET-E-1 n=1 Tax=Clonostachys rhizophaga TaxID=160324 RepID=A0A9N9VUP7_9HYPO|nr:unnamed protein product [Clonostachys rhizophaga]